MDQINLRFFVNKYGAIRILNDPILDSLINQNYGINTDIFTNYIRHVRI